MPIRSLLFSVIFAPAICGSGLIAAAQSTTPAPCGFAYGNVCGGFSVRINTPRPTTSVPHYVGPMGTNPSPAAFATPKAKKDDNSFLPRKPILLALDNARALTLPSSKKSTCYAIHSYTFKPESDTIGITHPISESTCTAADNSSIKRATRLPKQP